MKLKDPPKWLYDRGKRYGYPDLFIKAIYYYIVFALVGIIPTLLALVAVIGRHLPFFFVTFSWPMLILELFDFTDSQQRKSKIQMILVAITLIMIAIVLAWQVLGLHA